MTDPRKVCAIRFSFLICIPAAGWGHHTLPRNNNISEHIAPICLRRWAQV